VKAGRRFAPRHGRATQHRSRRGLSWEPDGKSPSTSAVKVPAVLRLSLVPRTTEFYDLFSAAGENALAAARLAETRFRTYPNPEVKQAEVKQLETEGDHFTQQIIGLLNTQYMTPFDREDIYDLAKAIDDVVDFIEEACDLLGLYKVQATMPQALEQCRILVTAADNLAQALAELRRLRGVDRHVREIKRLEDEGDRILRDAIAGLFENHVDPVEVIRWKDIFEALEDAIDACETVSDVVGNIVVKNL
jgi:predicted phosphate transport protein (TIGR00153 family)